MYHTVIVPLDGSPFAAQAVTTGVEIARRSGADLVLTRVHEAYVYEETDYSISEDLSRRDQEEYLADVAEFVEEKCGVQSERRLLTGGIVSALCTFARELEEPLIVMSTHGRTGFSRAWLGSVADAVARQAATPVLMLRRHAVDNGLATPAHTFRTIMVALDGSDVSESALPHAVALATAFESRLALARVVAPVRVPASMYAVPFAIPQEPIGETLDSRVDGAQSYLNEVAAHIRAENPALDVTTSVRVSDSTAPMLLEMAGWASADTIAVATHGRGASRVIAASIADKILRGGPEAVLIVRAEETA